LVATVAAVPITDVDAFNLVAGMDINLTDFPDDFTADVAAADLVTGSDDEVCGIVADAAGEIFTDVKVVVDAADANVKRTSASSADVTAFVLNRVANGLAATAAAAGVAADVTVEFTTNGLFRFASLVTACAPAVVGADIALIALAAVASFTRRSTAPASGTA
jgi:hypothetical protein